MGGIVKLGGGPSVSVQDSPRQDTTMRLLEMTTCRVTECPARQEGPLATPLVGWSIARPIATSVPVAAITASKRPFMRTTLQMTAWIVNDHTQDTMCK